MNRAILTFVSALLLSFGCALRAQDYTADQFRVDFNKGVEIGDEKYVDKAMKRGPGHALLFYEELYRTRSSSDGVDAKLEAMRASWLRTFENGQTLEKMHRWLEGASPTVLESLDKGRTNSRKLWGFFTDQVSQEQVKQEYQNLLAQFIELARNAETLGNEFERAELWGLAAVIANKMPEKTLAERRDVVFALEQFVAGRTAWDFTFDEYFIKNREFAKVEKLRLEEAEQLEAKRKEAGYSPDAKGVDSLVVPGKQDTLPLQFQALTAWEGELDYSQKGGPVPAFWWLASTGESGTNRKLEWFRRGELYLVRTGATKFGMATDPGDAKKVMEIDASPKGKPSTFWLDADRKQPYAMFFWAGSDRERVGEAECNLAPSDQFGNVYYRSAASWEATFGKESIVLYDDNASGVPGDADPFEPPLKSPMLGEHDGEGTMVPLLDSMRIGKGPRVPFSEFVHLSTGWFHLRRGAGDELVLRPLNPEFVPVGKVKLVWSGPKPTTPVQLVVQGSGDYRTACFELAGGKEVEVPAGTYSVIFGRIVNGKGSRIQMANLYRGSSPTFDVAAGKTFELKMGAPFTLDYTRRGDENLSIDALKILVREASGCVFGELHGTGMGLAPDVMAAKTEDGKGAKVIGKFVRFTDPELVNKAAGKHNNIGTLVACFPMPDGYREGEMTLSIKLPAEGMKVALTMKKHAVFGALSSKFQ
ncbi:MAG: hypothetical protein JNM25_10400 [Planctomycetes bacterium]|nr:hypothetical protein [Planctomycetota bacterium]